jgi:hypothetical protein
VGVVEGGPLVAVLAVAQGLAPPGHVHRLATSAARNDGATSVAARAVRSTKKPAGGNRARRPVRLEARNR